MLLGRGGCNIIQGLTKAARQAVRQALLPFDLCKSSSVPSFFMMMAPVQCSLCSQCSRGCYTACYCLSRAPPPDPCPTNLEMNIALTDVSIYIHSEYLLYMCPICALSCFFFELVTLLWVSLAHSASLCLLFVIRLSSRESAQQQQHRHY